MSLTVQGFPVQAFDDALALAPCVKCGWDDTQTDDTREAQFSVVTADDGKHHEIIKWACPQCGNAAVISTCKDAV